MPVFRLPRENELLQAAGSVLPAADPPGSPCPSVGQWMQIVNGAYAKDPANSEHFLEHLAACDNCDRIVTKLRVRRRRQRMTLVTAVLAACILLALAVSFWINNQRTPTVALLDLRDASPTRGAEVVTAPAVATLRRGSESMRIVLPVGNGPGLYQLGLFRPGETPQQIHVSTDNAVSTPDSREEVSLRFRLKDLAPGRYLFGVRTEKSPWDFYPINVQ